MLPVVCIMYNTWNAIYTSVMAVCFARSIYMCFFSLNFAVNRVMWYAVPDNIKVIAYPILTDMLPAYAKGAGAILTLILQTAGVDAGDLTLTVLMIFGAMFWLGVIHYKIRAGYMIHLSNSLSIRSVGDNTALTFDVNNKLIVEYVTDFVMLGDRHQRLFILDLLRAVPLNHFHDCLSHIYALKPDTDVVVKLLEVARLDENVVSNEDLLMTIHDDHEDPRIVGAALLAIGIRRLRDAFEHCEYLLNSEEQIIRLNAAIAVLHLNPTTEDKAKVKVILESEMKLANEPETRALCLKQLSAALYQKVKMDHSLNPAEARVKIDYSKLPRPRSRQIKRLGLDWILPLVAKSLTVLGTAKAAADVLDKFDSKEVQHMFNKLLIADEGGQFYAQSVFDYLAENSRKTYSNTIVNTLLELKLLQRPDMLGSKLATMVFRCIIAVAQNAPCSRAQTRIIKERLEQELVRCYRKLSVMYWLTTISFSAMLQSYLQHHIELTNERILLLLACICPYDPVDEYAEVVLTSDDEDQVASALELIEAAAPMDIWAKILPLLQPDLKLDDRVRIGKRFYPELTDSIDDALQEYLMSASAIWPAFVLDICIKNELNDFLDSVPWKDIQEVVTEMYKEHNEGRLTDGSHLMLEIMTRDNQKSRKRLREIKQALLKDHRQSEMKNDLLRMANGEEDKGKKKRSDKTPYFERQKKRLQDLSAKGKTTLLGDSIPKGDMIKSLDMLASEDGYGDPVAPSRDLEQALPEVEEESPAERGFLCLKKKDSSSEADAKAEKASEIAKRKQREAEEKILAKKRSLEYQVRFNLEFGSVGQIEMLEARPEDERRQALLERQAAEENLVVPTVIDIDEDIMKDFVDDGKGYLGAGASGGKFSWKSIFRRNKDTVDGFMMLEDDEVVQKKSKKKKSKMKGMLSQDAEQEVKATDVREEELIELFNLGYREIFFLCDIRRQRVLDDDEMAQLPKTLDLSINDDELDMIRKEMDVHKHGVVEWVEWLDWWRGDSPGFRMVLGKAEERVEQRTELARGKRHKAEHHAMRMAEENVEYWQETSGNSKMSKYQGRRVEIAGRGRGSVLEAKKKGLLVAFDGHDADWTGAVCGYAPPNDEENMLAPPLTEEVEPFEEFVKSSELDKIAWKVLRESPVRAFAAEKMRAFDDEVLYRDDKEEERKVAQLRQLSVEWQKAYKDNTKQKGAFGVISEATGLSKLLKKQDSTDVDREDPEDITDECRERFMLMDVDGSGTLDIRELEVLKDWFQELELTDELGVAIPPSQYKLAIQEILNGRWTIDFEEFMEWFTEEEARPASDDGLIPAVAARELSEMAYAVKSALVNTKRAKLAAQMVAAEEEEESSEDEQDDRGRRKKKKKKKKKPTRKMDPREPVFSKLFSQLDKHDEGRLTRPMLGNLCGLVGLDHMLGRELDKVYSEILTMDQSKRGIVDREVFFDWLASDSSVALNVATAIVRITENERSDKLFASLLQEGHDTLSVEDVGSLNDLIAGSGVKIRKREMDLLIAEIDEDASGEIDATEWREWLSTHNEVAIKIRAASRIQDMIKYTFEKLNTSCTGVISTEDWDGLTPAKFVALGFKVSNGDVEKARKELDITKTKGPDLEKFTAWLVSGDAKVGGKLYSQCNNRVISDINFEISAERRLAEAHDAALAAQAESDDAIATQDFTCDLHQFTAWLNGGSELGSLINHAAAELSWPEEEAEDLDPQIDTSVIQELWVELDWEDDTRITIGAMKNLRMLINLNPTKEDMDAYAEEIEVNEHGMFGYEQFYRFVNLDSPAALKVRRHIRAGKRGSDAANKAMAAMAMTAGGILGAIKGSGALARAGMVGARQFKQGITPALHIAGKSLFGVTKVTLTVTAKVTGSGSKVMERLEKSMLDPDLTEEQLDELVWDLELENEFIAAQDLVKLRTHLHCKLSDKDLREMRTHLQITGESVCEIETFTEWVNDPNSKIAKKIRSKARGPKEADPVETLREEFEMEARLRAFRQLDVWIDGMSTKKTKARDLPGRRVRVPGYGEGTVIGYKSSRFGKGNHVIEFDIGGIRTFRLDCKVLEFEISSDVFVEEYVEHALHEFDQEAGEQRQRVEKTASKEAMRQNSAWVSGAEITRIVTETPEELIGSVLEITKGKRGQCVGFKKGKHTIQLDGGSSHSMNLEKVRVKVLSDDFVATYAQPIVEDHMKRWAERKMQAVMAEREEIAAQEELDYEAKMELYEMQQAKQALADAAVAADQLFRVQVKAFKTFGRDFLPAAEAMDPSLLDAAGGIDAILRQTWITMPRYERSVYENNVRKQLGEVPWQKLPGFDQVEVPAEYMMVVKDTVLRKGYQMDTDEVGKIKAGTEIIVMRKKELELTKEERKKDKNRAPIVRIKTSQGWLSMTSRKGEPICEPYDHKEPSYIDHCAALDFIDVVSCIRLTEVDQENVWQELDPTWQLGSAAPAHIEVETFVRWLVGDSELAATVRGPWADLRWKELGPLLTYTNVKEGEDEGSKYTKYLLAANGAYQLTKFSLKGTWVATKVAGKIAVPITRTVLKATSLVSSASEYALSVAEKQMMQVDASEVKALFQWIHEELAVVMAMAPVALEPEELDVALEEMGSTGLGTPDGPLAMTFESFGRWLTERTMVDGPLRSDLAAHLLSSVSAKKLEDAEAAAEGQNKKKKKKKKKRKKETVGMAVEDDPDMDMDLDTAADDGAATARRRAIAATVQLHKQLEQAEELMENNFTMVELEKAVQAMDSVGDGEVSFEEFCLWYAGKSKLANKLKKASKKRDKEIADDAAEEAMRLEAEAAAAKELLVRELFAVVDEADPDTPAGRASTDTIAIIGPATPSQKTLTGPELNKMTREMDPTELGFIKEAKFVEWFLNPNNRIATKLLVPKVEEEEEQTGKKKSRKLGFKALSTDMFSSADKQASEDSAHDDDALFRAQEHRDLWYSIDVDGLRYVILDGFLEHLCTLSGGKLKLSKSETAAAVEV